MSTKTCVECGAVLNDSIKECPNCGCPVEENVEIVEASNKRKSKSSINKFSIITLIIGIIVLIMGISVVGKKTEFQLYEAKQYDADKAAFGADFYTEIYQASDTIVDELSDINEAMEVISGSFAEIAQVIYYSAGMIIIALGLCIISVSLLKIQKE